MRSKVTMIAIAALAVALTPALDLFAGEAADRQTSVPMEQQATATSGPTVSYTGLAARDSFFTPLAAPAVRAFPFSGRSLLGPHVPRFSALVRPLAAGPLLLGQASASMAYPGDSQPYTPRFELFLGYSYLRAVPTLAANNRLVWLNGGSTSLALNLNRYLGLVADFGGFDTTEVHLGGVTPTVVDASGTVFNYLAGPRLSYRKYSRITPFAQALFGAIHASQVTISSGCTPGGCTVLPSETAFAFTAGGGLDFTLRQHLALRIIQAEYMMTRFDGLTTGTKDSQNDIRLSTGIVFRFGGHSAPPPPPPMPLTYSCSVNPAAVFPGDPISVSGVPLNLNTAKTAVYTWSADGGTISGTSSTASIDTSSAAPGTYTAKGHVSEGEGAAWNADCTASYTITSRQPPTVSCTSNPSVVTSGSPSTITAMGASQQGRPLTYSYASTAGAISGSGPSATLSTTGAALGNIVVTCNVADDNNQTASATTTVTVEAPPIPQKPLTRDLCAIQFDRDSRRPSRVDNEAKACLDEVALSLQSTPDAQLAIVGNASAQEAGSSKLATQRAANTKAYLVGEKGIDASRIAVYTGKLDGKVVSMILIPAGATFDSNGDSAVQ